MLFAKPEYRRSSFSAVDGSGGGQVQFLTSLQFKSLPGTGSTFHPRTYYNIFALGMARRHFLDAQASLAPTQYPCMSVRKSVRWSYCQISILSASLIALLES